MNWKKITTWVLVIFALYTIMSSPDRAADLVQNAFEAVAAGVQSVQEFFDALVA